MEKHIREAIRIIRQNDRGTYTVPTHRLYPYQWNWDSGFTALGLWQYDRNRAWLELSQLLESQWEDGMVPHIVFRKLDPDYFPGPLIWQTNTEPPSSGHSQPPVLSSVVFELVRRGDEFDLNKGRELFSRLIRYHRWFVKARDPQQRGVLGIIHPWESGRDNCPDWDIGMKNVVVPDDLVSYQRRDTAHVDSEQRPTESQYERFLAILQYGRRAKWNHQLIYEQGPFLMADPGVQFVFIRATRDLLQLAKCFGYEEYYEEIQSWISRFSEGSNWLWNEEAGGFCARDLRTDIFSDAITNASMLCFYAGVGSPSQNTRTLNHAHRILDSCKFGMPSWDPAHSKFEPRRYWRGPVWAIMNYMIAKGLSESNEESLAARIRGDTIHLIENYGMAEYFDPTTGAALGGMDFSWTAAMYLEFAHKRVRDALGDSKRA